MSASLSFRPVTAGKGFEGMIGPLPEDGIVAFIIERLNAAPNAHGKFGERWREAGTFKLCVASLTQPVVLRTQLRT